jgi:hypothetical protein
MNQIVQVLFGITLILFGVGQIFEAYRSQVVEKAKDRFAESITHELRQKGYGEITIKNTTGGK